MPDNIGNMLHGSVPAKPSLWDDAHNRGRHLWSFELA